ncbi:MAG: GntR family transcriptional regulator [Actinobacteria bacterium]|jgi:DNA-binding GntR family transcriptional regulator|nr:GntR family transcriptional regulator [Actinomycetota bacterium]
MVRRGAAQTLLDDVYGRLRAEVLDGAYAPGERLVPADLAVRYGAGAGVLREALGRLASEHLATFEANRGYRVIDASPRRIEDLLGLRRINEGAALRLSIGLGGADYEARALAAHHRMRSAPRDTDVSRQAHHDFHMALLSGCGNERLIALCEDLFEASELYRRWSVAALDRPARAARTAGSEHRSILDAVLAHDADEAVRLHEQHLQRTVDLALAYAAGIERRTTA